MGHRDLPGKLFLCLHDPFDGKPRVSQQLLTCGLSAAELAHLMCNDQLDVLGDRVVAARRGVGADTIDAFVVDTVSRQKSHHTAKVWIEQLGDFVYRFVADDLVAQGIVRQQRRRGLLRSGRAGEWFPAVDLLQAASPRNDIEHRLANPKELDLNGAILAALLYSLNARNTRLFDSNVDSSLLGSLQEHLPAALQAVITGLDSAVAAVSLTVRR